MPLTDAERSKKRRNRKAGGLIHVGFDPVEDVLKAVLIAAGLVNESEAANHKNLPLACETLIAKLGNRLKVIPDFMSHAVTPAASTTAEPSAESLVRTKGAAHSTDSTVESHMEIVNV